MAAAAVLAPRVARGEVRITHRGVFPLEVRFFPEYPKKAAKKRPPLRAGPGNLFPARPRAGFIPSFWAGTTGLKGLA